MLWLTALTALLASEQAAATRDVPRKRTSDPGKERLRVCAPFFGRCGGDDYDGPTCCPEGGECVAADADSIEGGGVSRCLPRGEEVNITDPSQIDVLRLSLVDTKRGLEAGVFTSETITRAFLDQIRSFEDELNAFTFLNEFALSQARSSDRLRRAGLSRGTMEGVPIVIKESLDVLGLPSTLGWNATSFRTGGVDLFPLRNAEVVQVLADAGAVLIGKTNIPFFSGSGTNANTSWDGPTFNAVNEALAPGGSSTGTGTAVAAGFAVWGVGEETGGSIQNPAAAQSLVGIKPTLDIVPTRGLAPLSPYDTLGPIAKTVKDAALALDAMTGVGTPSPTGAAPKGGYGSLIGAETLRGKRIGLFGDGWTPDGAAVAALFPDPTPEVSALYERAVLTLEELGATTLDDPFLDSGFANVSLLLRGESPFLFDLQEYLTGLGVPSIGEFVDVVGREQAAQAFGVPVSNLSALIEVPAERPPTTQLDEIRAEFLDIFEQVFEDFELDALIFPQSLTVLPSIADPKGIFSASLLNINIAGLPLITVPGPAAKDRFGGPTPFSLAFVGPQNSEPLLLALAHDYEQATRHRIVPGLAS